MQIYCEPFEIKAPLELNIKYFFLIDLMIRLIC